MSDFTPFLEKMQAVSVSDAAIRAFKRNFEALLRNESGMISEDSISSCDDIPSLESVSQADEAFDPALLASTVVIKLNGGLGTSMGLQKAKTLLPVQKDSNFLDIIARQILHLRETTQADVRFLLMNSFSTSADTLEHMQDYSDGGLSGAENIELLQNQIPKIDAETFTPALAGSGWLQKLLDAGVKYAFVSNSDNLGAVLDASLLRYFAQSDMPFLMEVTRRTEADKKGGHLAVRKSDEQLLLREVAQCDTCDLDDFQNIDRHRYFNTNSLWVRLDKLSELLAQEDGVIPLPMIRNQKTIDPRDKKSTAVYQLEVAMGAAIEAFSGAGAISVPRSRFAPVKTTSDLFALRSDAYRQTEDGRIALVDARDGKPPVISLSDEYKMVDSLEGLGMPSLINAGKLTINGPVRFAEGVSIHGDVTFVNETGDTQWIAGGKYENEEVSL